MRHDDGTPGVSREPLEEPVIGQSRAPIVEADQVDWCAVDVEPECIVYQQSDAGAVVVLLEGGKVAEPLVFPVAQGRELPERRLERAVEVDVVLMAPLVDRVASNGNEMRLESPYGRNQTFPLDVVVRRMHVREDREPQRGGARCHRMRVGGHLQFVGTGTVQRANGANCPNSGGPQKASP